MIYVLLQKEIERREDLKKNSNETGDGLQVNGNVDEIIDLESCKNGDNVKRGGVGVTDAVRGIVIFNYYS